VSYFDDHKESPALELWAERLNSYIDGQEGVEALRPRMQPNPPWPEADNPMLGYLLARAMEIYEEQGPESAITWVAVHAWFAPVQFVAMAKTMSADHKAAHAQGRKQGRAVRA